MTTSAMPSLEDARVAAGLGHWREAYDGLRAADDSALAPADLELFADCAWWRGRVEEDFVIRQRAFAGFVAAGDSRRAIYNAWLLSARHRIKGDDSAATGWLRRAQRMLADEPPCVVHGYVSCSEAEVALGQGHLEEAARLAAAAIAIGQQFHAPELVALGLCWQGLAMIVSDDVAAGLAVLDEAMCSVLAGELDDHFTGWIACFAIGMSLGVADVGRALIWTDAAQTWCESLPEATPYHGLCRVRRVEMMSVHGDLKRAEGEAHRACEEMLAFQPRLAGEAFYVAGEVLRRKGDLEGAEAAFGRARELGLDPQPGLARVRLAQRRVTAAAAAVRTALAAGGRSAFHQADLLAAQVEIAVENGDHDGARAAAEELAQIAAKLPASVLRAMAASAHGQVLLAADDAAMALTELRFAASTWRELNLPLDAARARILIGVAMRQLGDSEGAMLELEAARQELAHLGAADVREAERLMRVRVALPSRLTARECEVLRLVATGRTNRQIAEELVVSEHTVARHLSNIFTKLGVTSRSAATDFAFEQDLVPRVHGQS
ncbi:MAG: LuxR C-terminal-related transcriptional regulator [Mycobacteriales bacterium]